MVTKKAKKVPSAETSKLEAVPAKETTAVKKPLKTAKTNSVTVESSAVATTQKNNRGMQEKKPLDHAAVSQRAWEIWQNEGCPSGKELEHWLRAESELSH